MNLERLIRDVKYYWDIDLKEFIYRNDFGPYPNFDAVVNSVRSIRGVTLIPIRDGSENFLVHFKRPESQLQTVSMIHASNPKKRNRPLFRKNSGNETFENSEFARWLRARSGQPKQSDISKDEAVKSRRSVAPYLLKSIFDECLEKYLENFGNFPEKSSNKQKDQEFVSTKWGEVSLKNNMMRRKFNDLEPTGCEKEENVGNKVRGDNGTMGFPSLKLTKELATSPVANDEEIIKFTVNKEDKSELNGKGKVKLDRTKDVLFDEDVLPTMEEVKNFLGEQTQDKEIKEYAKDLGDDPDVIKDDGTFFRIVDNLLGKEKKFKFPAMLKSTYVGEPPRLHKVKALN